MKAQRKYFLETQKKFIPHYSLILFQGKKMCYTFIFIISSLK